MSKLPDVIGRVYSGMTVLERRGYDGRRFTRYLVRCHCGQERELAISGLREGRTKSCGCIKAAQAAARAKAGRRFAGASDARRSGRFEATHGHRSAGQYSPEYRSWKAMLNRCSDPTHANWKNYGGRGISVCDRWRGRGGFARFFEDMGPRALGKELDRIDNDGNYEPGNVRWVTRKENLGNRRSRGKLPGQPLSLAEQAEQAGVSRWLMHDRLRRGWSIERAVSEPPRRWSRA